MSRKVVAIDGLAGSGKTSIAQELAKLLGYTFFSSGRLYRTVGYLALKEKISFDDIQALSEAIKQSTITLDSTEAGDNIITLNGEDISSKIFSPEVSEATSRCAVHEEVRTALYSFQRNAFSDKNIVAEGRDMGTVVFPNAEVKFFIQCEPDILVERRLKQMHKNIDQLSVDELNSLKSKMKIEIVDRNKRDRDRTQSPTIPAEDALIIDNSSKTLTEIVKTVYSLASEKLASY